MNKGYNSDNDHIFYGNYIAKVENNEDIENRGRVQLRVVGIHSPNDNNSENDGIPLENLPWAEQAGNLFGGFGGSTKPGVTTVPTIGSYVYCFFLNGNFMKPVYFASVIGNDDRQTDPDINNYGEPAYDESTVIKTKSGHTIKIIDKDGIEEITIEHKEGSALSFSIFDNKPLVVLTATENGKIVVDANDVTIAGGNGYPLLANSSGAMYTINGQTFFSASKTKIG